MDNIENVEEFDEELAKDFMDVCTKVNERAKEQRDMFDAFDKAFSYFDELFKDYEGA